MLSGDPRSLVGRGARAAVAARGARRARRSSSARSRRRAREGALGALPVRAHARRPRRGDDRPLGGGARALRGGDRAGARDGAGHAAVRGAGRAGVRAGAAGRGGDACERHAGEALALAERARPGPSSAVGARRARRSCESARAASARRCARLEEKRRMLGRARRSATPTCHRCPSWWRRACAAVTRTRPTSTTRSRTSRARPRRKGQPWALARLARARGLLADGAESGERFAEALDASTTRRPTASRRPAPGCASASRLRRAGRRVDARASSCAPRSPSSSELGAAPWAERARAELLATGETARRRDPSTLDDLTPQELQVGARAGRAGTRRARPPRSSSSAPRPWSTTCATSTASSASTPADALAAELAPGRRTRGGPLRRAPPPAVRRRPIATQPRGGRPHGEPRQYSTRPRSASSSTASSASSARPSTPRWS